MIHKSDILIIGTGITGCALARELSRYTSSVVAIDQADDISEGATKANSGIVHAGYDALPGTQKAYYNTLGTAMYSGLCRDLGLPYKQNGALVVAFSVSERQALQNLKARGEKNGVPGLQLIEKDEILHLEPQINPEVVCALSVPTSAVISPYETAFAMADDAAINGVSFLFNQRVTAVSYSNPEGFTVSTPSDTFRCACLINCAGSSGADIHNMLSDNKLDMVFRRGQYFLLDKPKAPPFTRTIFQCPSPMGKGILVTPTVHGNVLLGPNAEDIIDPLDTSTTSEGLSQVLQKALRTWPGLSTRTNITNFSGIRSHLTTDDFIVGSNDSVPGYFEAIGIESPGLSSAPAIAVELRKQVVDYLRLDMKDDIIPYTVPLKPFSEMSAAERNSACSADPSYGNIICRCETVTEAEIRAAIRRPVGARSIDGVKRRTRAGMGRCQGGFCLPRVAAIISEETGIPLSEITKNGGNSYLLSGTVSDFLKEIKIHE